MDDVISVLCEVGTDCARIRRFVSWDIVSVEDGWKSRNVHGEDVDGAAGSRNSDRGHARQQGKRTGSLHGGRYSDVDFWWRAGARAKDGAWGGGGRVIYVLGLNSEMMPFRGTLELSRAEIASLPAPSLYSPHVPFSDTRPVRPRDRRVMIQKCYSYSSILAIVWVANHYLTPRQTTSAAWILQCQH